MTCVTPGEDRMPGLGRLAGPEVLAG
jgi:hypothetical protein